MMAITGVGRGAFDFKKLSKQKNALSFQMCSDS